MVGLLDERSRGRGPLKPSPEVLAFLQRSPAIAVHARARDLELGGQFGLPSAQIKDALDELCRQVVADRVGEPPQLGVLPGATTEAKRRATALDNCR